MDKLYEFFIWSFFSLSFLVLDLIIYTIYTCALRTFISNFSLTHLLVLRFLFSFFFSIWSPWTLQWHFPTKICISIKRKKEKMCNENKKNDSNPELYIGVRASENFFRLLNSHKCRKEKMFYSFLRRFYFIFPFSQTSYTSHWIQFLFCFLRKNSS